jgi:aspartyl protease family protein
MSEASGHGPPPQRPVLPRLLLGLAILACLGLLLFVAYDSGFSFDSHDAPHLVALIAILVFLSAILVGRQMRAYEVLRGIAVWAAIIIVIAGLYASRDELTGFAGRLLGALVPGVPVSGRLAGDSSPDSVVVTRARDGHFAVRTAVDGVPTTMLVDTGASLVTLSYRDAMRAGIAADTLDYVVPIRTANGRMAAASVLLDRLTVGPIEQRNVRALVAPRGALDQSLLGMSFLDRLTSYAIAGDRLILTP